MLIINADDWGRSAAETDAALACHRERRITSVSAMVFMADSGRAAELALGSRVDAGLHLNFSEPFSADGVSPPLRGHHERIVSVLRAGRISQNIYHPLLRRSFDYVYQAQAEEFARRYGGPPSHVDGHQHMHLCANLLLASPIPRGRRVRRSFSFRPAERWGIARKLYRLVVDWQLARRFCLTDFFFDLSLSLRDHDLTRVTTLAKTRSVELMTHPVRPHEFKYLLGAEYPEQIGTAPAGTFASL